MRVCVKNDRVLRRHEVAHEGEMGEVAPFPARLPFKKEVAWTIPMVGVRVTTATVVG